MSLSSRIALLLPLVVALAASAACVGARTSLTVPRCVERIEVEGEHTRTGDGTLVFHHMFDLPFTKTDVTVEKTDGTSETVTLVNTNPDVVHLVGSALVGSVSTLLVALYGFQVTAGGEPFLGPTVWALPIGVVGLTFASALLVTGWHPSSDTVLETGCSSP